MSEFKNFVTLEKADIKLKHAIIYGLRGFDTLNDTLTDIWTPDVIHNQLRGVLAGIGMTRPLVELGIGIRDIVAVPVAEIRKDGFKVRLEHDFIRVRTSDCKSRDRHRNQTARH
jgi:autophagy-related protein 2